MPLSLQLQSLNKHHSDTPRAGMDYKQPALERKCVQ